MAKRVQLRRGTTAQTNTFTGAVGEVTVDTDKKTVVVHDGVTVGGTALAKVSELSSLVPQATETVAGKAKIATTAIAQAGTNDTDFITALKLKNTLGASKNALAGTVNFNGTGTVSIRSQLNVSSITDLGVGKYKINMTTAMPDANYPVFTSVADRPNVYGYVGIEVKAQTANSITVFVFDAGTGVAIDGDFISVGWTP